MELKETPVYYLESEEGLEAISFVDNPATKIEWFRFSEEIKMKFEFNEMERIVTGPIMLAETNMWRAELNGYVKFSKEQIKDMAKKTFKKNSFTFNENHDPKKPITGVHLVESYFIGDKVESKLYSDLPEGTWMGSFYVEDKDYWNNVIMSDNFKGFSLEGNFKPKLDEKIIEARFSDIEMILKSDLSDDVKFDSIKSLLFACPPKGDGTRKDGEPDKRCGDGTKKAGAKGGSKTAELKERIKQRQQEMEDLWNESSPENQAAKEASEKDKKDTQVKKAQAKIDKSTFSNPASAADFEKTGVSKSKAIDMANDKYNSFVDAIKFGPNEILTDDHTWNYKTGAPNTEYRRAGQKRKLNRYAGDRDPDDIGPAHSRYKIEWG